MILGNGNHSAQRHHVDPYGIIAALLFRAEENLKVRDECRCKLSQSNVAQTIACLDKFFQVLVNGTILMVCGITTQTGRYLLGKILIVLGIDRQQCLVPHLQTQESVLYFLRRDIVVPFGNLLVFGIDTHPNLVQEAVGFQCDGTFSRSPVALDIP